MTTRLDKKYQSNSFGEIAYLETGDDSKPPVLFVHGIPTSSYLWRHVLRFLQDDFHCIAPDLMGLGDTRVDPKGVSFEMDAQAEMLSELMTKLGHEKFGLVCHDQGGAAAQLLATREPHRIDAFVLTDCVCYDNWPVPRIEAMQRLARVPVITGLLGRLGAVEWLERNSPLSGFRRGVFDPDALDDASITEFLRPLRGDAQARESFQRFLLAGHPRHTELAAAKLREFDRPTLVLWAADDRYLSPSWGRKLAEEIPGVRGFELISFCGHFWQEERPSEFASHISTFLAEHLTAEVVGARPSKRRTKAPCAPRKQKLPVLVAEGGQ